MRKLLICILYSVLFSTAACAETIADIARKECSHGIKSEGSLTFKVIHERSNSGNELTEATSYKYAKNTGNCFKIDNAEFLYLIKPNVAIYRVLIEYSNNPLIAVDMGSYYARYDYFKGVVKGVASVTYKDERGLPHRIPLMRVVKTDMKLKPYKK